MQDAVGAGHKGLGVWLQRRSTRHFLNTAEELTTSAVASAVGAVNTGQLVAISSRLVGIPLGCMLAGGGCGGGGGGDASVLSAPLSRLSLLATPCAPSHTVCVHLSLAHRMSWTRPCPAIPALQPDPLSWCAPPSRVSDLPHYVCPFSHFLCAFLSSSLTHTQIPSWTRPCPTYCPPT